jgi:hypothetical protein
MTNADFARCMAVLGWDNTTLAARLRVQRSSVQRWHNGAYTIPDHLAAWMTELADLAAAGDDDRYNAVLEALPNGWQGDKPNVDDNQRARG